MKTHLATCCLRAAGKGMRWCDQDLMTTLRGTLMASWHHSHSRRHNGALAAKSRSVWLEQLPFLLLPRVHDTGLRCQRC